MNAFQLIAILVTRDSCPARTMAEASGLSAALSHNRISDPFAVATQRPSALTATLVTRDSCPTNGHSLKLDAALSRISWALGTRGSP